MREKFKYFRAELHLSQDALGRLVGRSTVRIRQYEGEPAVPAEVVQKMKALAMERNRPDLAGELWDEKWPDKQAGETRVPQVPKKLHLQERDFGAELHSLLDDILQGPIQNIEATESALRLFANPARQQPVPVNRPRRRRG